MENGRFDAIADLGDGVAIVGSRWTDPEIIEEIMEIAKQHSAEMVFGETQTEKRIVSVTQ